MKICIIGRHGFIGSAIARKFELDSVKPVTITSTPTKDCELIIDLGSPVHPPFEENPDYYFATLIPKHLYLLSFSRQHNIQYMYASSALVYEERQMAFTNYKRTVEELAKSYSNTLALRIFPVYGPGEKRTAIYQACKAMMKGEQPVIYGDGTQERDFIYIDDVADQILRLWYRHATGVADVGAGKPVSFNKIVETINEILDSNIKPKYVPQPANYAAGIVCKFPMETRVDLKKGIERMLRSV